MKRCSTCDRALSSWHLRCQVCKSFNWQTPHIVLSAILLLALTGGIILGLDHLSYAEPNAKAPSQITQTSAPASAAPQPRVQYGGSGWKGRPASR